MYFVKFVHLNGSWHRTIEEDVTITNKMPFRDVGEVAECPISPIPLRLQVKLHCSRNLHTSKPFLPTVYTMSGDNESRLATELELLNAMYPDQIDFNLRSRDFKFSSESALLHLRLPEHYPSNSTPDVISASDSSKIDLRDQTKAAIRELDLVAGEEALDAVIACFQGVIAAADNTRNNSSADTQSRSRHVTSSNTPEVPKTVIIWLHHLLALSKRKLALAPASTVSGVTKPGYPGIMIFSGPTAAVSEHVDVLKAQNWQAFQVRYEECVRWEFAHGVGVKEVESMAEVVREVEGSGEGVGRIRKEEFLMAAGIK
jgi:hypothetical protein